MTIDGLGVLVKMSIGRLDVGAGSACNLEVVFSPLGAKRHLLKLEVGSRLQTVLLLLLLLLWRSGTRRPTYGFVALLHVAVVPPQPSALADETPGLGVTVGVPGGV